MKNLLLPVALAMLGATAFPLSAYAGNRIDALSTSDSGCHWGTRSDDIYSDDYDADAWDIDYTDGVLSVTWINFVANCCPDGFTGWFELEEGNHLIYNLMENESLCDCMCVFDVATTFGEIEPGHYTISFCQYSFEVFSAEVDIEEGSRIHLEKAPAGIHSLTAPDGMMSLTSEGVLQVSAPEPSSIEIYDASGAIRVRMVVNESANIDVASLAKGIYIVKLITGDRSSTLRFVR